jgi:hypothetical protein
MAANSYSGHDLHEDLTCRFEDDSSTSSTSSSEDTWIAFDSKKLCLIAERISGLSGAVTSDQVDVDAEQGYDVHHISFSGSSIVYHAYIYPPQTEHYNNGQNEKFEFMDENSEELDSVVHDVIYAGSDIGVQFYLAIEDGHMRLNTVNKAAIREQVASIAQSFGVLNPASHRISECKQRAGAYDVHHAFLAGAHQRYVVYIYEDAWQEVDKQRMMQRFANLPDAIATGFIRSVVPFAVIRDRCHRYSRFERVNWVLL